MTRIRTLPLLFRPLCLGSALALAVAAPAMAHEALRSLIPLTTVYAADRPSPEFDVAGIRCAGLFAAQEQWARAHGNQGMPSRARRADIDHNLDLAQITRNNAGMDLGRAHTSTQADLYAVVELYAARFRTQDSGDTVPWQGDGLITSDTAYCDLLNGRR